MAANEPNSIGCFFGPREKGRVIGQPCFVYVGGAGFLSALCMLLGGLAMKNGFCENRVHDCKRLAVKHRPDLYFEPRWLRCPGFFQKSASTL